MTLSIIAKEAGPVTTIPPPHAMVEGRPQMDLGFLLGPTVTATHTFRNAPTLDILFVPGGEGNVALARANDTSVEDFIATRFGQLDYLLSVCTGAASLAKAGILNSKRATTNKGAWSWVTSFGTNVTWVPTAGEQSTGTCGRVRALLLVSEGLFFVIVLAEDWKFELIFNRP